VDTTRRTFLATASLLGTSAAWAGANDRLRVGVIGLGDRAGDILTALGDLENVEVAAVCDPDANRLRERAAQIEQRSQHKPEQHADLRRILDDQSIDAVVVATCNHWHALAGIWACQADKHAYVEKPVSHNFLEGEKLVAAARKYGKVVSGGTQRRSHPNFQHAVKLLREGVVGDIYMSRWVLPSPRASIGFKPGEPAPSWLDWNLWRGPAPEQAYHANLVHYNWHWFWDFGNGEMGNNGSHSVDICHWALGGKEKGLPTRISCSGGRFGYKDQAQTPNTQTTTWTYADGTAIEGKIVNLYTAEPRTWQFYGTKGYMEMRSGGLFDVYLDGARKPEPSLKAPAEPTKTYRPIDRAQLENWADAVRAGDHSTLNAEIEDIHLSNSFCHFANVSYRVGREVRFDEKARRFEGDDEANRLLGREYHKDFAAPAAV
jgi:predicted dehydrogenase